MHTGKMCCFGPRRPVTHSGSWQIIRIFAVRSVSAPHRAFLGNGPYSSRAIAPFRCWQAAFVCGQHAMMANPSRFFRCPFVRRPRTLVRLCCTSSCAHGLCSGFARTFITMLFVPFAGLLLWIIHIIRCAWAHHYCTLMANGMAAG